MARRDTVTIQGRTSRCFNLSGSVGFSGQNDPGDVMLVQAYLIYVNMLTQSRIGEFPDLALANGRFDMDTSRAIYDYCRSHVGKLLSSNGLIDPASYYGRNIKNPNGKLMIITRLHLDAQAASVRWGHADYTNGMILLNPQLGLMLKPNGLNAFANSMNLNLGRRSG